MKNKQFWIIAVVVIALVGFGFYLASKSTDTITNTQPPATNNNIKGDKVYIRDYSHMTGDKTKAKVTLIEFGDFECPVCASTYPVINDIVTKYKSDPNFNYIFRNFPLPQHTNAPISASAAESAAAQGKYFEMVSQLYTNQDEWSGSVDPVSSFVKYAQSLNLDVTKFQSDVTSYKYYNNVQQDLADGNAFGVNATPTFYLLDASGNATQFVGAGDISKMSSQIDTMMSAADKVSTGK
jgi:protein-disulfide isomerase